MCENYFKRTEIYQKDPKLGHITMNMFNFIDKVVFSFDSVYVNKLTD
jgi:hypothetical protein